MCTSSVHAHCYLPCPLQEILDECGPVDTGSSETAVQLPDNQTRFIFGCLVSALSLAHSKNYAHHDVKAGNFVRFYDGRYKLIDWDTARRADKVGSLCMAIRRVLMGGMNGLQHCKMGRPGEPPMYAHNFSNTSNGTPFRDGLYLIAASHVAMHAMVGHRACYKCA